MSGNWNNKTDIVRESTESTEPTESSEPKRTRKARYKILALALLLLMAVMAFGGSLNYMTFADNYNKSLANTYAVAGNELVRKIEYALQYGKPIDNFYGMHETLAELKVVIPEVEKVKVVSTEGEVLYDLFGFVRDQRLPDELQKVVVFQEGALNDKTSYRFYDDSGYIFLKITDDKMEHIASLAMVLPDNIFLQFNSHYTKQLGTYLLGFAAIALLVLFIILFKTNLLSIDNRFNKKRFLLVFIVVLGSVQLFYSAVNYSVFKNAYIDMAYKSKDFVEETIANNINSVYDKGISLQNVSGLDHYITAIESSLPQIKEITFVESKDAIDREGLTIVRSKDSLQSSTISATISNVYIDQEMYKILLDMVTVLIVSIFFMVELILFAVLILVRQDQEKKKINNKMDVNTSHGLVRTLTFLVNIPIFMSITFIPIVMQNLYEPILGLSKDVVLGLPLSAEMLGGILAIILAGSLVDKKGWRAVFYVGILFLALGNFASGFSMTAIAFVLSRAVVGFGVGLILMSLRSLVVSLPERNSAIAEFASGAIAGLNCGAVIGGMMSDRIGYDAVFFIAAITVVLSVLYTNRLMGGFEIEERKTSDATALHKFINFIYDKKTIVFLLLVFIPFFIGGAFLDYYFPLFASNNGLSQSDISRAFLLNGLCIIYLGPLLTRYASNRLGTINGMLFSLFIIVCALAVFMLFGTLAAALVTIVLLGMAESFGVSMQTNYFLNLKGVRDLEISKGIAYFSIMVNLGRMAGPIIFGVALSFGMKMGVGLIALALLLLLMGFVVLSKVRPEYINESKIG
ncbi:MFS transporter [Heliorestis convoluta]|uniref:Major Facilitator Superfamily Protein n=1 Tax=Heliorestis convoluta TaxID=356322 RepID=A0A5Q2N2H2_9FIRM|nr:MFS transporter [Heliorestis convoluta]QGG48083.1 Major Facilitator Superfamily Protein [Heliorestis convoluta]